MYNFTYAKLKGRIVEKYGSQKQFAKAAGISNVTVSMKLNGQKSFSQKDIINWSALLDIDLHDVGDFYYS